MYGGGETADEMVRMTLQGIEVAANIALKAGTEVARSFAATLYAILTDKKKIRGKTQLNNLLKSGKELKVFGIRNEDLKVFCQEAKKYGVLYSVLKEKNSKDGICDIMVRAEDAPKISRIVDKYELAKIDSNAIKQAILASRDNPLKDVPTLSEKQHDNLVNQLMNEFKNPIKAQQKTSDVLSEHSSNKTVAKSDRRTSIRKQLKEINKSKSNTSKVNIPNKKKGHKKVR